MSEDNEERSDHEFGSNSVDFNELEARNAVPAATDYTKLTIEGEGVPEGLKGKSVADAIAMYDRALVALRASEESRQALKASSEALTEVRSRPNDTPVAPTTPTEPELTLDQWKELYETDAFSYHEKKAEQLRRDMAANLQTSIAPLAGSAADLALANARTKYPDEFAALGKDIESMISRIPDKRALSSPGAIDDLVAYVRGKEFDKFYAFKQTKNGVETLDNARHEAAEVVPRDSSVLPQPRKVVSSSRKQIDDTEKIVADALGVSYEDFMKHK